MKKKSSREVKKDLVAREDEILERFDDLELEKSDSTAMILAALLTFLPVILGIFAMIGLVLWLILR